MDIRSYHINVLFVAVAALLLGTPVAAEHDYARAHRQMISDIEDTVRETSLELDKEALDPRVMRAMASVPRHEFVAEKLHKHAYENRPLPIGHGQTISQPYMVAIMTDLIKPRPGQRVLEIGTGSAYQAAILGELVGKVYTIEIIEPLGVQARERLDRLGYDNIETRIGDGYYGWEEHAPFDAIVVTAAADHIPPPLLRQLKVGGRMIIPVGSRFMVQQLVLVEKPSPLKAITKQILPVSFVPLTGDH